jgi:hypothetical protein
MMPDSSVTYILDYSRGGSMISLDGLRMHVSATASNGVVGTETVLQFSQRGDRVVARYAGGRVERGWLVGRVAGRELHFRYAQRESSKAIHGGSSRCEVTRLPTGRVRIVEHFAWSTREGSGTNVFDEVTI